MIIFIGALKPVTQYSDYNYAERLLMETIMSIHRNKNKNFTILIICHTMVSDQILEKIKSNNINIFFHIVPEISPKGSDRMDVIRWDRGIKYMIGLFVCRNWNPNYIMFFDTDDIIDPALVSFVENNLKESNGWYVERGLIENAKSGMITELDNFHSHCGTCNIINFRNFIFPPNRASSIKHNHETLKIDPNRISLNILKDGTIDEISKMVDSNYINFIIGSHKYRAKYFSLKPIHMLIRYRINHGENYSQESERRKLIIRSLRSTTRKTVTIDTEKGI